MNTTDKIWSIIWSTYTFITKSAATKFWLVVGSIYGILFWAIQAYLMDLNIDVTQGLSDEKLNLGWLCIGLQVWYILASSLEWKDGKLQFKAVNEKERGLKILMGGLPIQELDSGPFHAPLLFIRVHTELRREYNYESPRDAPDFVQEFDKDGHPKAPAHHITHAQKDLKDIDNPSQGYVGSDATDVLQDRLTSDVQVYYRWRVVNVRHYVGRGGGDVNAVNKQLDDIGTSFISSQLALRTPSKALQDWDGIQASFMKKAKEVMDDWGVELVGGGIRKIGMSHSLNSALADVAKSKLLKTVKQQEGLGEGYYLKQVGKGAANARKDFLKAEGDGYEWIAKKLGIQEAAVKQVILTSQVARDAFEKANYNTVHAGGSFMSEMTAAADAIKQVLNMDKPATGGNSL